MRYVSKTKNRKSNNKFFIRILKCDYRIIANLCKRKRMVPPILVVLEAQVLRKKDLSEPERSVFLLSARQ